MLRDSTTGRFLSESLTLRFWRHVDPCRTDGCAVWLGATNGAGYGKFNPGRGLGLGYAHHVLVGKPPAGMQWDHVKAWGCINTLCVWPEHLELVTQQTNILRSSSFAAVNAAKTHCRHGHEFTAENTIIRTSQKGRECRECARLRNHARYAKY